MFFVFVSISTKGTTVLQATGLPSALCRPRPSATDVTSTGGPVVAGEDSVRRSGAGSAIPNRAINGACTVLARPLAFRDETPVYKRVGEVFSLDISNAGGVALHYCGQSRR